MTSQDVLVISVSALVLTLIIYEFGQMSMLF
ncbi:Uncharacterised protein [Acinetobacter johnsonii]|jgi:hypothetical protein|uniref:Uncharacterized protein n=1 Tax=Acinetobacter johnsonii TaxID=40214 RepID=A0A380TUM1_ACIJO|nr:hypothetical protein F986_01109 [Acinetobacter johnsonii CIP 64.6]SUT91331.1 Uncharacterised protein [Acinetobacter johnsonii]